MATKVGTVDDLSDKFITLSLTIHPSNTLLRIGKKDGARKKHYRKRLTRREQRLRCERKKRLLAERFLAEQRFAVQQIEQHEKQKCMEMKWQTQVKLEQELKQRLVEQERTRQQEASALRDGISRNLCSS